MSDPVQFEGTTPRYALPLLFAGQAQKEFFVNEAMLRSDFILHAAIEGEVQSPPAAPAAGQVWLVGASPSGAFAGYPGSLAGWSGDGWRYIAPRDGLRVFDRSKGAFRLYSGSWGWQAAPSAPSGGAVIDTEARAAIVSIVERLVGSGVFAVG